MSNLVCTAELKDKLEDLHRGLHIAMDALVNNKDYRRTEEVLREMDFHFVNCLRALKVARPG